MKDSVIISFTCSLCSFVVLMSSLASAQQSTFVFLNDDSENSVACMAMIPECFTKKQWFKLCGDDLFMKENKLSCEAASTE
jgi:virulence-associated protein VapD